MIPARWLLFLGGSRPTVPVPVRSLLLGSLAALRCSESSGDGTGSLRDQRGSGPKGWGISPAAGSTEPSWLLSALFAMSQRFPWQLWLQGLDFLPLPLALLSSSILSPSTSYFDFFFIVCKSHAKVFNPGCSFGPAFYLHSPVPLAPHY